MKDNENVLFKKEKALLYNTFCEVSVSLPY